MAAYLGILFLAMLSLSQSQVPIPSRPLGFPYNLVSPLAKIYLDVYLGPLCPDSQAAFPTLIQVAEHYGPDNLRLNAHLFPLPYHRHAFDAAKGAYAVDIMTQKNMTWNWMKTVYNNLDKLGNDATYKMTQEQIEGLYGNLAQGLSLNTKDFLKLLTDPATDELARIGWKYACTRGIAYTPAFMVNDIIVGADDSWTLADWQQLIDPLLNGGHKLSRINFNESPTHFKTPNNKTCPKDTKTCEYLPKKIECCTKGENCIPNVGCRC
ncbi:hypothetical protein ACJMK2_012935 [Sinanodonta woodiana]|uniref:Thioredoxin-like fold domain-containing protein n=1 Tax=Sinanodonta woodiana TaxID=1069815 RepID=A0ABD3V9S8_SINWO